MTGLELYELKKRSCAKDGRVGRHCGHWDEGDGPCCFCNEPNWGENGEDGEVDPSLIEGSRNEGHPGPHVSTPNGGLTK